MDLDNAILVKNLPGRTSRNNEDQNNRTIFKFKNINLASNIEPPKEFQNRNPQEHRIPIRTSSSQVRISNLGVPGALMLIISLS